VAATDAGGHRLPDASGGFVHPGPVAHLSHRAGLARAARSQADVRMSWPRASAIAGGLALAAALAGCGQRGPLYLPDQNTETVITRPGTETTESAPQPGAQTPNTEQTGEREEEGARAPR